MPLRVRVMLGIAVVLLPAMQFPGNMAPRRGLAVDSLEMHRELRDAQGAFERRRRLAAPRWHGGIGRCDERIGRFCYWYDAPPAPLPPEPEPILEARAALLSRLDEGALLLPGDDWIAGQRIRYLVESGDTDAARRAATACRGTPWWCSALAGYALHASGQYSLAEEAFDRALAAMPEERRCEWSDLTPWLDGEARGRYGKLDCAGRVSVARRFWWLAQPSLARDGNDLRTEFLARRVHAAMQEDAANPYRMRFGEDQAEMMLRYGWSIRWTRTDPGFSTREEAIQGHEPRPGYSFAPDQWWDGATPASWPLSRPRPRFRYAPPYARGGMQELVAVQLARFRRGDSLLLVGAWMPPADTLFTRGTRAVLSLAPDADHRATRATTRDASSVRVLTVTGIASPASLVEVQLADSVTHAVARRRQPVGPLPAALSDPLLLRPAEVYGETLEDVLAQAMEDAEIPQGSRVGVYWEMYGLPDSSVVQIAVTVRPLGGSFFSRLGRSLGLSGDRPAVRMAWDDIRGLRAPIEARAVGLDLSRLGSGRYRLTVSTRPEGGRGRQGEEGALAHREIVIR